MKIRKRIAIYGSTGSIGTQALEVIEAHADLFELEILTAHSNADLLIQQAKRFKPNMVVISDESLYTKVNEALSGDSIKVFAGEKSLIEIAGSDSYDILLAAIVGFAGLSSTIAACATRQSSSLSQ
jgi:1-deoxy-D-xylulose-5-phosphate reductoisomerase